MFRGTHLTRLDEKGRLKMPAEFKREIDENYSAQFYITSWDGRSAKVYPMQQKFLERTSYYGQVVEFDGQGRLLMPQILRETASLKGEVAVMGNLKHLVVRNAEELRKSITEPFTEEDETVLSGLGI